MLGLQMPVTTLPGSGRRRAFIQREHKEKLRETVVPSRIVMVQWLKTKKGSLVHWFCHGQQQGVADINQLSYLGSVKESQAITKLLGLRKRTYGRRASYYTPPLPDDVLCLDTK